MRPSMKVERNRDILRRHREGVSGTRIAAELGISNARVYQILNAPAGGYSVRDRDEPTLEQTAGGAGAADGTPQLRSQYRILRYDVCLSDLSQHMDRVVRSFFPTELMSARAYCQHLNALAVVQYGRQVCGRPPPPLYYVLTVDSQYMTQDGLDDDEHCGSTGQGDQPEG